MIAGTFENKGEKTMTYLNPTRTVRRGRLFPEIQWSEEKKPSGALKEKHFISAVNQFSIASNQN